MNDILDNKKILQSWRERFGLVELAAFGVLCLCWIVQTGLSWALAREPRKSPAPNVEPAPADPVKSL